MARKVKSMDPAIQAARNTNLDSLKKGFMDRYLHLNPSSVKEFGRTKVLKGK